MNELSVDIVRATAHELVALRKAVLRPEETDTSWCDYDGDRDPRAIHLRSLCNNVAIGMVTCVPEEISFENGCLGYWRIRGLGVVEAFRRNGIGGRLLADVLKIVQHEEQGKSVWLSGRTIQERFYRSHGFVVLSDVYDVKGTGPHYDFLLQKI